MSSEKSHTSGWPPAIGRNEPTVLIVDDIPYLRELGSTFLAQTARVVTAGGGQEALDVAWRERPDLIVSDLHMPGMDGAAFCRAVRRDADLRATPFIMLVSSHGAGDRGQAVRAGADDVLAKPLSQLALVAAVTRLLSSSLCRGLPRVQLEVPVTLTHANGEVAGTMRNLSRGGVFVETAARLAAEDEVSLRFRLPGSSLLVAPSAEVMWCRVEPTSPAGAGLRFVELDGRGASCLDDFVQEHAQPIGGGAGP